MSSEGATDRNFSRVSIEKQIRFILVIFSSLEDKKSYFDKNEIRQIMEKIKTIQEKIEDLWMCPTELRRLLELTLVSHEDG